MGPKKKSLIKNDTNEESSEIMTEYKDNTLEIKYNSLETNFNNINEENKKLKKIILQIEEKQNVICEDYERLKKDYDLLNKKFIQIEDKTFTIMDEHKILNKMIKDHYTNQTELFTIIKSLNERQNLLNEGQNLLDVEINKIKEENEKKTCREKTNIDVLKYHNNYINNIIKEMKKIKIIFDNRLFDEINNINNLTKRHDKFIIDIINMLVKDHNHL